MKPGSRLPLGAMLLLIIGVSLIAGCTQPAVPETTPTPVPTIAVTAAVTMAAPDNQTLKADAASLAASFAGDMNGTMLSTAIREGENSTAFATVLGQLKAFKGSDTRIAYVYTIEQKNGTVRFIIDANYGLPDGSGFLQEYPDAAAELRVPVTAPIGAGPYTDSWGTFVSGYAPVDTGSNATIVLIGVDIRV